MLSSRRQVRAIWYACAALLLSACQSDGYKDRVYGAIERRDAGTNASVDANVTDEAGTSDPAVAACTPSVASDKLPARSSVLSTRMQTNGAGVFTKDLFSLFRSHCGGCHVDQGLGGLQVSLANFPVVVTNDVLSRIRSDDPQKFMPPLAGGGVPFSQRKDGDPVVELLNLLDAWIMAGSPADVFYPSSADQASQGQSPYALTREVGLAMTNVGNCIPTPKLIGTETAKMDELDAFFASATELPERLEQTDLVSLDSAVLARYGVIAIAPAYTLWADNAKKVRMIRVPRGTALELDPETQDFKLPTNTRVYKTFYKGVIDHRGLPRYRKIETRVIVSRPDTTYPDGSYKAGALFGTYVWNDAETEAVLLRDPLRNRKPFRDRIITIVTDEQKAEEVIAQGPKDLTLELEKRNLSRTYALPGSERCIHCHMGAPNKSFVLGVTPLQLKRRPLNEGGVIEPAERDELNQFQRLIEYGLIKGADAPDAVLPLEASQGDRKARNEHELNAQGYMMGNCAHCHNPRGFPSVAAPELSDLLNFWPSKDGGIFQFPLERKSPRIRRIREKGTLHSLEMPYITPSLFDLPESKASGEIGIKWIRPPQGQPDCQDTPEQCRDYLFAPWRSAIYRNVDAPFSYSESTAIFPHMPMDTHGYDCRARQVLGSWMVSIPSAWKFQGTTYLPSGAAIPSPLTEWMDDVSSTPLEVFLEPQPHREVLPDDPTYKQAQFAANRRLRLFQTSPRYFDCPDPALDVVDPNVVRGAQVVPGPSINWVTRDPDGNFSKAENPANYSLLVPERPHFAETDLTEPSGEWYPRRPDWATVLTGAPPANLTPKEVRVLEVLSSMRIEERFRAWATTDRPFGLWKVKPGCDFSGQKRVSELTGSARPAWFDTAIGLPPDGPVYEISPGEVVFSSICSNCHGPQGDSRGRLAATIADMTGGQTRVANLRDGFFGPPTAPSANLERVFGGVGKGLSTEEWAARYLLWMGAGGTQRIIPPSALALVAGAPVLGERRSGFELQPKDANMLTVVQELCGRVLLQKARTFDFRRGTAVLERTSGLITSNGDAELWQTLCTYNNPLPGLALETTDGVSFKGSNVREPWDRGSYPADALVGDPGRGVTKGLASDNRAPWCIVKPDEKLMPKFLESWPSHGLGAEPPYCPPGLRALTSEEKDAFTQRGAFNGGLAVFLYLEELTQGKRRPTVPHDQCEKLAP